MKNKITILFFAISLLIITQLTAINEGNSQKTENSSHIGYWQNMSTAKKVIVVTTGSLIVIGGILYYIYGGNSGFNNAQIVNSDQQVNPGNLPPVNPNPSGCLDQNLLDNMEQLHRGDLLSDKTKK